MTRNFSPQEIEQLSTYLDGQLPVREKTLLELRLRDDPELQTELEALARTHLMLRALPKRRAPRSFALTPAMVARRQSSRFFPAFRLASALTAVLLVIVFTSDLLLGSGVFNATGVIPLAAAPAANQSLNSRLDNNPAPNLAAPEIITWGTPTSEAGSVSVQGMGGGGKGGGPSESFIETAPAQVTETQTGGLGGGGETPAAPATNTAPVLMNTEESQQTPTPEGNMTLGSIEQVPSPTPTEQPTLNDMDPSSEVLPSPTTTETPTPTPSFTPTPTLTETPSPAPTEPLAVARVQGNPILGVQPMVESQGLRASAATTEPTPQPADSGHTTLRLTEILLGAAALVTALLAAFFYRKEHL
jgi:hypothetical protein